MTMQQAMLGAMRAQYRQVNTRILRLNAASAELTLPGQPWSTRQTLLHLWAWQQRSIARLQAALQGGTPQFAGWAGTGEQNTADLNEEIWRWYGQIGWTQARRQWQTGYRQFVTLGSQFSLQQFLDSSRYPFLDPYSVADVYLGSYEHHAEHLAWFPQSG